MEVDRLAVLPSGAPVFTNMPKTGSQVHWKFSSVGQPLSHDGWANHKTGSTLLVDERTINIDTFKLPFTAPDRSSWT